MLLDGEGYAKDVLGLFARFSRAVHAAAGPLGEPPLAAFKHEWRQLDFSRVHELRGEEDPWTFLQTLYAGMVRPTVLAFDRAVAQGARSGPRDALGGADGSGGAEGQADGAESLADGSDFVLGDDGFPLVYELIGSECMASQTIRDDEISDKVLLTGVATLYGLFCVYETQVRLVTDVPVRAAVAPDAWSRLAAVALCARRRRWAEVYRVWLFLLRNGMALHAALLTEQSVDMAIGSTADGIDEAEEEDEDAASRVIADVQVSDAIDVDAIERSVRTYLVARRKFEMMPGHDMSTTFYRVGTNFGAAIRNVLDEYHDASLAIDAEEQARRMRERKGRAPAGRAATGARAVQSRMIDVKPAKRGDMPQVGSASKPQTVLKSPRPRASRAINAAAAGASATSTAPGAARRGSRRSTDDGDLIETLEEMLNGSSDEDASSSASAPAVAKRARGRPRGSKSGKGKGKGKGKGEKRPRGRPPKAVPRPLVVPAAPASAIPDVLMAEVQAQEAPAVVQDLAAGREAPVLAAEDGSRAQAPLEDVLARPAKRGRGRPKGSTTKRPQLDEIVDPDAPRATRQRKPRKPLEL